MANPAVDLATHLASLGTVGGVALTLNGNVFHGEERPLGPYTPAQAVFVMNEPGAKPIPYMGENRDWHSHSVALTVRSNPSQYVEGEAWAFAINAALHRNPPAGYVGCFAQQTSPDYDGEDEQRIHSWLLSFTLWRAG